MIVLRQSAFQKMKNDLSVLGIILVLEVVYGFSSAGQSQRRDEMQFACFGVKKVGECPMVVAGWFEPNANRETKAVQEIGKGTKSLGRVLHSNFLSTLQPRRLNERLVTILGNIDGYPDNRFGAYSAGWSWSVRLLS